MCIEKGPLKFVGLLLEKSNTAGHLGCIIQAKWPIGPTALKSTCSRIKVIQPIVVRLDFRRYYGRTPPQERLKKQQLGQACGLAMGGQAGNSG